MHNLIRAIRRLDGVPRFRKACLGLSFCINRGHLKRPSSSSHRVSPPVNFLTKRWRSPDRIRSMANLLQNELLVSSTSLLPNKLKAISDTSQLFPGSSWGEKKTNNSLPFLLYYLFLPNAVARNVIIIVKFVQQAFNELYLERQRQLIRRRRQMSQRDWSLE